MPYVIRDESGRVIALTAAPNHENDQPVALNDPEVLAFFINNAATSNGNNRYNELLAQDFEQIRIVEDLIDLLTAKGIILFSELPAPAQEKILRKKTRREEFGQSNDILVDDVPFL